MEQIKTNNNHQQSTFEYVMDEYKMKMSIL